MAEKYINVANQETSDEINSKMGTPEDIGGTEGIGSLHAKENTLLRQTKQILDHLKGEYLNNFGDGRMGDFVYGTSPDTPVVDEYNRRVYYTDNFTVPTGKTMKVTSKNNGMIIWARGDITIDGTLDISEMRNTSADPTGLPTSIDIAGINYTFAKGGYKSSYATTARSGNSGKIMLPDGTVVENETVDETSYTSTDTKVASVSGGDISVKRRAISLWIEQSANGSCKTTRFGGFHEYAGGAGAVILICAGTIKITGTINAKCTSSYNKNGSEPSYNFHETDNYFAGKGGEVLVYQGGGGAVTIISKSYINTGTIRVSGNSSQTITAGTANTTKITRTLKPSQLNGYSFSELVFTGGGGANSYTIGSSSSGEIKQYTLI